MKELMKDNRYIKSLALAFACTALVNTIHAQHTEKVYLSGDDNGSKVEWDFFCTSGMNSGKWSKIAVPSCWELQGFGKYDYGFAKDSVRGKEQGKYRHKFNVPATWKSKAVRLVFEGSMTDTEVKMNGISAGDVHQGGFYSFDYDVTRLLKFGSENLLEVTVSKHSANESVNAAERRADYWIFGGIFRPVFLEVLPQTFMDELVIHGNAAGRFTSSFVTRGGNGEKATVDIVAPDGRVLSTFTGKPGNAGFSFTGNVRGVSLWTPETPFLYTAIHRLYANGRIVHSVSKKFGFRTIEVKQRDGIYVNGVKVRMKGVNRHSFRPETGRTLTKMNSIEDVLLMKDMNMNAVRMSHYPPDAHFLDVCDSLGLFVMDELAGWHGHYDTPTGTRLVRQMIYHDFNHPSVVIWANGNEGGHNTALDSVFYSLDSTRPVVHPWQLFGGIETQHYREYNYGIGNYDNGREIVMPTEFLHGQFDGGHGAGLEDYWEKMWHTPLSAGGFLWDLADQAVVRRDLKDSLDTDKHRGADGIVGPHHEKEGSYFAIKEIWSPVKFDAKEITKDFDGTLHIENRYHFTNLDQCSFSWKLKIVTSPYLPGKEGKISSPNIAPGARGTLKIDLPADWNTFYALYVTATDNYGREIITKSYPIIRPDYLSSIMEESEGMPAPQLVSRDSLYVITAKDIEVSIHERTGLLVHVKKGNVVIPFSKGPVITEGANNFGRFSAKREGVNVVITSAYDRKDHYNTLKWTIFPTGIIKMEVNYFPGAYFTSMAGVNFSYPESRIESVSYLGNGPHRVWKNRLKGTQFGVWTKKYNNTETGESPWIYPEFKGYHSNLYWCRFTGDDHSFIVTTINENIFLRLFTPAWKTDQWHNYEPIFPPGDISFMNGIPGIGTKTQRNETTGPMGMKNIFYDYEKDPTRALNMVLYFDFTVNK